MIALAPVLPLRFAWRGCVLLFVKMGPGQSKSPSRVFVLEFALANADAAEAVEAERLEQVQGS